MKLNIILGVLFAGNMMIGYAQQGRQVHDQALLQEVGLQSNNPAMLQSANVGTMGESSLGYQITDGQFKHPLLGDQSHYMRFSSARYEDLKDWKLYGKFNVNLGRENNVAHTTQLNPLRLNPYIVVDSLQGDWNKQDYAIDVAIASPYYNDRVSVGMGLRYEAKTGARQRDPRTQNTHNFLEVRPAVAAKIGEQGLLGAYGLYSRFVEDLRVENINNQTVHNIYRLLGLGEYVGSAPTFISSGAVARRYEGDKFGVGLTYMYTAGNTKVMAEAFFNHYREDAVDGSTYPQNAGQHNMKEYGAKVWLHTAAELLSHNVQLAWVLKDVDNTEFHQYQDPTTREYITLFSDVFNTNLVTEASLRYDIAKRKGEDLSWKLAFGTRYDGWDNRYATNQSQQTVDRLSYKLDFDKYFANEQHAGFIINIGVGYSDAFRSTFHYEEKSYSTNLVAREILYPTNAFLETDFWLGNVAMQYVFKPARNNKTQFYMKAGGHYRQPTNENNYFVKSMSRLVGQLAIGVYSF